MNFPRLDSVLGSEKTPFEVQQRLNGMRAQCPFLILRDDARRQRIVPLSGARFILGRSPDADLCLGWDPAVSTIHASLERNGERWTVDDDGLSRNGTFVNDTRVHGRRLLAHGEVLQLGGTRIGFVDPRPNTVAATVNVNGERPKSPISPAQRRVLIALCRPMKGQPHYVLPASNQAIATELHVSIETVKTHLRDLYKKLGFDQLAPREKRSRLAWHTIESGIVQDAEL